MMEKTYQQWKEYEKLKIEQLDELFDGVCKLQKIYNMIACKKLQISNTILCLSLSNLINTVRKSIFSLKIT